MSELSYVDAAKANIGTATAYAGKAVGAGISIYEAAQGNAPELGPSVMYGSFALGMQTVYGLNTLKSMKNTEIKLDQYDNQGNALEIIEKSLDSPSIFKKSSYCKKAGVRAAAKKKGLEDQIDKVFENNDISKNPSVFETTFCTGSSMGSGYLVYLLM
jgi:hypothetical protein